MEEILEPGEDLGEWGDWRTDLPVETEPNPVEIEAK